MKKAKSPSARFHEGHSHSDTQCAASLESREAVPDSDKQDMPPISSVQLGQSTPKFLAQLPGEDAGQFLVRQYENIAKWALRRARYLGAIDPGDLLHDAMLEKLEDMNLDAPGIQFMPKDLKDRSKSRYRSQQRRSKYLTPTTEEIQDCIGIEDLQLRSIDAREEVRLLLPRLRPKDRQVLEFIDLKGGSQDEFAALLGKSKNAIKSRLCRARARAKKELLALRRTHQATRLLPGTPKNMEGHNPMLKTAGSSVSPFPSV